MHVKDVIVIPDCRLGDLAGIQVLREVWAETCYDGRKENPKIIIWCAIHS